MVDASKFRSSVVAIGGTLLVAPAAFTAACLAQTQRANPSTNYDVLAANAPSDCSKLQLAPRPPKRSNAIRSCGGLGEPGSLSSRG
jgi:hypothetical protein